MTLGTEPFLFQPVEDEWLEEFEGHLFGQAALLEFELGTDHDDRTAGVVHALAEEILAEPPLLAAQGLAKGLKRTAVGAQVDPASLAVVEEGVDGLLEHSLFVADDKLGGLELHKLLQPVVSIDNPPVEVVEVRR